MLMPLAAWLSGVQPYGPSLEVAHLVHGEVLRLRQDLRGQLDLRTHTHSIQSDGAGAQVEAPDTGLAHGDRATDRTWYLSRNA